MEVQKPSAGRIVLFSCGPSLAARPGELEPRTIVRPAIVVSVNERDVSIVALHVFHGDHRHHPLAYVDPTVTMPEQWDVPYDPSGKTPRSWHWPPRT